PFTAPIVDNVNGLLSRLDHHIRHQPRMLYLGEDRLDVVGLRADDVDKADVLTISVTVDVVSAGEVVARRECGGKQNAIGAFDGHQWFANDKGRWTVVGKVLVELRQFAHRLPL